MKVALTALAVITVTLFAASPVSGKPDAGTTAGAGKSDKFKTSFEYAGKWICDGDVDHSILASRNGRHVHGIYNSAGYDHTFDGVYFDDHTIVGVQTRISHFDQSSTRMSLTYVFESPDCIQAYWVALDANSDLAKGQSGHGVLERR